MNTRIIILLVGVCGVLGQENDAHLYLTQLQLSLREEKFPSIINNLLNNSLEIHGITTRDIIGLSKLDRFDENDIVKVLGFFNITEVYTVDNLETLLTTLNISFGNFYDDLIIKMGLSSDQVTHIVESLQIPPEFWRHMSLHQNAELYSDLRKGVYDEEHVGKALAAAGRGLSQVYSSARDLLSEKVSVMSSSEFMSILNSKGWSSRAAMAWYKAANLTTRDVYQVEKFRKIFANISDNLNRNITLGTFVEPNQLALHKLALEDLGKIVDETKDVKVEANGLEVTLKNLTSLGKNIVAVASNQSAFHFIEKTEAYNSTGPCTYVTLQNGEIIVTEVTVDDMTIKYNRTGFVLGSPLICDELLYGLAGKQEEDLIVFDGFYTEDHPPEKDDGVEDNESGSGGLGLLPCGLILTFNFLIALVLL